MKILKGWTCWMVHKNQISYIVKKLEAWNVKNLPIRWGAHLAYAREYHPNARPCDVVDGFTKPISEVDICEALHTLLKGNPTECDLWHEERAYRQEMRSIRRQKSHTQSDATFANQAAAYLIAIGAIRSEIRRIWSLGLEAWETDD